MGVITERTVAVGAFVASGYTVSLFDRTGAQPRDSHAPLTAIEVQQHQNSESATRGDSMLLMLFLGAVHLTLLWVCAQRWIAMGTIRRAISSSVAGAVGYALLLGAVMLFRPIYAAPRQSTWLWALLLALPTVVTTVVTSEFWRWRVRSRSSRAEPLREEPLRQ